MKAQNILTNITSRLKSVPRKYWVIGGVLLTVLIYSLVFFVPKQVQFSYSSETCVSQLLIAPGLQKPQSEEFTIAPKGELKIGSFALASTQLCVEPTRTPVAGSYKAQVSPFGGVITAKRLAIIVPEAPLAKVADFNDKSISTVRPLEIGLSDTDTVHEYTLAAKQKEAKCSSNDAKLLCDVSTLNLSQGSEYEISLSRSFKGSDKQKIVEGKVETLLPLNITEAGLTNEQVVYTKPKEFAFVADRPVASADFELKQVSGDDQKKIDIKTDVNGNSAKIAFAEDLPRNTSFTLLVKQIIGLDGSALAASQTIAFTTSGGPKVSAVSVGGSSVDRNARITVTFDQPIAESVDIAKVARIEGVNGSVEKISNEQLVFSLSSAPDCSAFKLVLDKDIASSVNDELSEVWSHSSRIVCGTSSVIGYSVRGRAIVAYTFGSGAETLLFTGGIHGSERSAQQTMQAWVEHLQANGGIVPANRKIVVVPNTNPDAIAANSRYNVNNVNIDRNFPASNWAADIDTASGRIVNGGGTSPGSEPETRALINLTRQLRPRLSISFHAQGRLVGANQVGISVSAGNVYSSTVGYGTMYGNAEEVMGYPITGEYEDWMGEEMGIAAILIELPTHSGNYLNSQLPALRKMLSL